MPSLDEEPLSLAPYEHGRDALWDRLGKDWLAIDALPYGKWRRIYVQLAEDGHGRRSITGLCITDTPITSELLRSIPVGRIEAAGTLKNLGRYPIRDLPPLRRQRGGDPDAFAEQVAMQYRLFSAFSSNPAKRMADHSGISVATVRGWIHEARLRGKLPPGRQGRAG